MRKIAVIGSAGSGKSTLSRQLGELLGLEVIHLDRHYWQKGWVETPRDKWIDKQKELMQKPSWIIDGNYSATMDIRFEAADTIIFIDLPRMLCVYRAIKRRFLNHGTTRPDMGEGCPEKIDLKFIKWIWEFPYRSRPKVMNKLEQIQGSKRIYHLRSRNEVALFLKEIQSML